MQTNHWSEVWAQTDHMRKPLRQKSMIPKEDLPFLNDCYKKVFQGFTQRGKEHLGLKVFVDQQRDYEATDTLMKNPPGDYESLEEWGNRVFEGKKYGIILNDIQNYSPDLMEYMARFLQPLLRVAGLPSGGLGLLFFVGNYGFTPFGVHKENTGEEGFLFHIGPGEKTFYTWKTEDYSRISRGSNTYPPEELMDTAIPHKLEPGDMMCIPSDVYHIGHTGDFSISMVLDFLNSPAEQLKLKMAVTVQKLMREDTGFNPLQPLPFGDTTMAQEKLLAKVSLQEPLQRATREYIMKLESNGGFYSPSHTDYSMEAVQPSDLWKLKDSFPISYYVYSDEIIAFARGHRIKWPADPQLIGILENWNQGKSISANDFPSSDSVNGFQTICYLLSLGTLQKV
ncbi:MAG: hypothetical protein ACPF9D_11155 [Owenweeksia sp.]